jgi:hypothetical protein
MMQAFEMTDLGLITYFLGMKIKQSNNEIFICYKKFVKEILKKFHLKNCKPPATQMNENENFGKENGTNRVDEEKIKGLIGCLMYLSATRLDILYATSLLSRYMHCPSEIHLRAAKLILIYIKGTVNFGVQF